MGAIGAAIFKVLKALYGEKMAKDIIAQGTKIIKPTKLDRNAPTGTLYSKSGLKNPKALDAAEEKIREYAPTAMQSKNIKEQMNFLENAENVLAARNAQTGTTRGMSQQIAESMFGPLGKSQKTGETTDIFDIKTQQPVTKEGIETLKSELGLPEGVEPGSLADKAIKESAQYKMDQQGVASLLDPKYKKPKSGLTIEEEEALEGINKDDVFDYDEMIQDIGAKGYSAIDEARRRPLVRQILLRDKRIDLTPAERESLSKMDDLQRGGDQSMDPLNLIYKYYDVQDVDLFRLEQAIDDYADPLEAVDVFNQKGGFMPKDRDLGDKLKDLPDDTPEMADGGRIMSPEEYFQGKKKYDKQKTYEQMRKEYEEYLYKQKYGPRDSAAVGGRIGYSVGMGLRIAKFFSDKGLDLARELKKAVDDIFPSGDRKLDADVVVDNMLEDLGVDRDMFDQKDISELYGMAYDTLSEGSVPKGLAAFTTKKGKGEVKMADEVKVSQDVKDKIDYNRQRMEDNFTKEMAPKLFLRMELKARFPGITDDMISKIMADDNPQRIAEVLASMDEGLKMMEKGMSTDEIINVFKTTPRTKQAGGGLGYLQGY